MEGYTNTYLGDNNYALGMEYLADRNAISPNGDDFMDSLTYVYTGLFAGAGISGTPSPEPTAPCITPKM